MHSMSGSRPAWQLAVGLDREGICCPSCCGSRRLQDGLRTSPDNIDDGVALSN